MFVREKTARGHTYLYLVESVREGGRVRQQVIRALGRTDVLLASGELDRLIASLARHSERAMILSDMEAGRSPVCGSAGRCCSGACGTGRGFPMSWPIWCAVAASRLRSSARSSPASCTACSSPDRTGRARRG